MIKKKISMLGAFGVGKTSLVKRYVHSIFSEKYLTTIGVKVDEKIVKTDGKEITLLLWDIQGEDYFLKVPPTYLTGSSGYFLVIDGTRPETYHTALSLQEMARQKLGDIPFIALINKSDLFNEWKINEDMIFELIDRGWKVISTSAKEDKNVEEAFSELSKRMLKEMG